MNGKTFFCNVRDNSDLEWLGCREGSTPSEDDVLVRCNSTNARFAISISAIRENAWDDLLEIILGKRPAHIMTHITRIVGYYSQLRNWNPSKIAELRDRHIGDYALPEWRAQQDLNLQFRGSQPRAISKLDHGHTGFPIPSIPSRYDTSHQVHSSLSE